MTKQALLSEVRWRWCKSEIKEPMKTYGVLFWYHQMGDKYGGAEVAFRASPRFAAINGCGK